MAANHTNPKGAQTATYVTRLSDGEGRLLVPAYSHTVYAFGYLLHAQTRPWVYSGYFSPDGNWLAYTFREEETDDVFIIPFPGPGAKTKVSRAGGTTQD